MPKVITLFTPTKKQAELYASKARYKVAVWGRRSGKSTYALNDAIRKCMETGRRRVWIVCPTYGQAKDIYWRDANMLKRYLVPEMGTKLNETDLVVEFPNGSILQFKGADRPDTLRGSGLDHIVGDEISEWRYAKETWEAILSPALADKQGTALFIGTPKGENYFKELAERGEDPNQIWWETWRVPTWESGAPWTLTEEGQAELDQARGDLNEDYFMQEFGAEFRKFTGLVFKSFDRGLHVHEFEVDKSRPMENGMDFGWKAPTAYAFTYFTDDEWWIFDEYYATERTVADHAGRILAQRHAYDNDLKVIYGDAANSQTIQEFGLYNMYITPAKKDKDSIKNGINRIEEYMKVNPITKKPRLHIHPRCVNLINELSTHQWKQVRGRENELKDVPEDGNDHMIDSIRYVVLHHHARQQQKAAKIAPIKYTYRPRGGF